MCQFNLFMGFCLTEEWKNEPPRRIRVASPLLPKGEASAKGEERQV
ncbi:hypothetical protein [Nodularia sphaerocarpa]|nr:hypothetical protein [Nodularia sphaerocarpa]MDB9374846.1 hypothetical protein [Nodularia sphaerocarpa CS-585]